MLQVQFVRAGRKRKSGHRHPGGKLIQHERGEDVVAIAIKHPDRQSVPVELRIDHRASTPLGRLFLRKEITAEELEAGRRYARDARRFHTAVGAPSPNCKAIDPDGGGGTSAPLSPDEICQRMENYNNAFNAVMEAGIKSARAVARVAMYEEFLPQGCTQVDLQRGLFELAIHYGLTRRLKSDFRNAT